MAYPYKYYSIIKRNNLLKHKKIYMQKKKKKSYAKYKISQTGKTIYLHDSILMKFLEKAKVLTRRETRLIFGWG